MLDEYFRNVLMLNVLHNRQNKLEMLFTVFTAELKRGYIELSLASAEP
jgi:hypothetical protein